MSPAVSAPRTGRDASDFDVTESYNKHLNQTSFTPMPIAAILALCDLITATQPETTSEMMIAIRNAVEQLRTTLPNPLPATAGADVFQGLVGAHYDRPDIEDFELSKVELLAKAHEFARTAAHDSREAITELSLPLISDDSVILTHSYSRVVMQVLLKATKRDNKRVRVYVTESRSTGKGFVIHLANALGPWLTYVAKSSDLCRAHGGRYTLYGHPRLGRRLGHAQCQHCSCGCRGCL